MVGPGRLELPTLRLSGVRSNHLSYGPVAMRQAGASQARDRTLLRAGPDVQRAKREIGKRNEDGGVPQFIGASIMNLVRASLETHP